MKSVPSNMSNCKISWKNKMHKFGTKNTLLGHFGLEFWKTIVILKISTLKFVKKEPLTHTVNFGIGSAFSKGPGSGSDRFIKYAKIKYKNKIHGLLNFHVCILNYYFFKVIPDGNCHEYCHGVLSSAWYYSVLLCRRRPTY